MDTYEVGSLWSDKTSSPLEIQIRIDLSLSWDTIEEGVVEVFGVESADLAEDGRNGGDTLSLNFYGC